MSENRVSQGGSNRGSSGENDGDQINGNDRNNEHCRSNDTDGGDDGNASSYRAEEHDLDNNNNSNNKTKDNSIDNRGNNNGHDDVVLEGMFSGQSFSLSSLLDSPYTHTRPPQPPLNPPRTTSNAVPDTASKQGRATSKAASKESRAAPSSDTKSAADRTNGTSNGTSNGSSERQVKGSKVPARRRSAESDRLQQLYDFRFEVQRCLEEGRNTDMTLRDCLAVVRTLSTDRERADKEVEKKGVRDKAGGVHTLSTDREGDRGLGGGPTPSRVRDDPTNKGFNRAPNISFSSASFPSSSAGRTEAYRAVSSPSHTHTDSVLERQLRSAGCSPLEHSNHSDFTVEEQLYVHFTRKYGLRQIAAEHVSSLLASAEGHAVVRGVRKKGEGGAGVMVYVSQGSDKEGNRAPSSRKGRLDTGGCGEVDIGREERGRAELRSFLSMYRNEVCDDHQDQQTQLKATVDRLIASIGRAGTAPHTLATRTQSCTTSASSPSHVTTHTTTAPSSSSVLSPPSFCYSFSSSSPSVFHDKYLSRDRDRRNTVRIGRGLLPKGVDGDRGRERQRGTVKGMHSAEPDPSSRTDVDNVSLPLTVWGEEVLRYMFPKEECFVVTHLLVLQSEVRTLSSASSVLAALALGCSTQY